jgi:hypothetical protein
MSAKINTDLHGSSSRFVGTKTQLRRNSRRRHPSESSKAGSSTLRARGKKGDEESLALLLFPVTMQLSAWYSGIGLAGLALLLALTIYAFHTSLGGQPLFGRASIED